MEIASIDTVQNGRGRSKERELIWILMTFCEVGSIIRFDPIQLGLVK